VSHELRTPLNAIIGFSELLMHERMMQADEKRRLEYAQLIHQSGHHLLSVVNGILDVSKIESGTFEIVTEPCRLDEVVRHCLDLMALKAKDGGVDLVARLSPALPEIVADKRALTQIMINLISNAVKFTGSGGRVTVFAERVAADVRVVVEDTGIGISAEDLPRLGNPFFQGRSSYDRPYEGTGLGLSVVKGLIDLHGGRIAISSRVGEGTRVEIRLPLDAEGRAAGSATNVTPIAAGRASPVTVDQQVKRSA
jgi:cell cycle sensor histidine kinase DivJ